MGWGEKGNVYKDEPYSSIFEMNIKKLNHKGYFTELFRGPKTIVIVSFFLSHPTGTFLQREIIKRCRLAKATASKELSRLEGLDLFTVERVGQAKLYRLNRSSLFVKQLKRFFNLVSPLLQEFLSPLRSRLVKAVVFGSYGRGEDREDSDVDILLVGDVSREDAVSSARSISATYGKTVSFIIRTPEEYLSMPKKEQVLWNKIQVGGEIVHGA